MAITKTIPSFNYAKDWLRQLFLNPGLQKGAYRLWLWSLWGSRQPFPVYYAIFGMMTTNQPNNRVILLQVCSWPVWEGSIFQLKATVNLLIKRRKKSSPWPAAHWIALILIIVIVSVCDYKNTPQGSPRWSSEEFARLLATSASPGWWGWWVFADEGVKYLLMRV